MFKNLLFNCCLVLFYLCLFSCSTSSESSSSDADHSSYKYSSHESVSSDDGSDESTSTPHSTKSVSSSSEPSATSYDKLETYPASFDGSDESPAVKEVVVVASKSRKKRDLSASTKTLPKAGKITAGEWNDLQNWADWTSLNEKEAYLRYKDIWGFNVGGKNSITLLNNDHYPIIDQEVKLLAADDTNIWKSFTDNTGKVELWSNAFSNESKLKGAYLQIDKKEIPLSTLENEGAKGNIIYLDQKCSDKTNVDIMFVVDATGSMTDEINFLKSELIDVLQKSERASDGIKLRTASVFYKDKGDNYLTKESPFTEDPSTTIDWIKQRTASGGGDSPEAVEAGLAKALEMKWSKNARTRLLFLLLDAPPHKRDMERYRALVQKAAEKGIKIIPISASGIERETEFLLKYTSILTNGTYVFITHHSGIGNLHLTPVVKDYEVELLNNLLVRVISNYAKGNECQQQQVKRPSLNFNIFPNPASMQLNVTLEREVDELRVTGPSGKLMIIQKDLKKGQHKIDISQLVDGMYQLSIIKGEQIQTEKMIVSNNV